MSYFLVKIFGGMRVLLPYCLQAAFGGELGPKGQLWTTESIISGWLFGLIFAVELAEPYSLYANGAGAHRCVGHLCC